MVAIEAADAGAPDLEMDDAARRETGVDDVLDHLALAVDGNPLAAGEGGEVDVVGRSVEAEFDAVVDEALAKHPPAEPRFDQHVDRPLFEDAGADAVLDVVAAAVLDDDRLDPFPGKQVGEEEAGRARSDNPNLRPLFHLPVPCAKDAPPTSPSRGLSAEFANGERTRTGIR